MKHRTLTVGLLALIGAFTLAATAAAQPGAEPAVEPGAEDSQAGELAAARERLAEAARDVARLSSQAVAPVLEGFAMRFGDGRRAMLGLTVDSSEDGVLVQGVTPGGPAAAAGVVAGDLITAIDGLQLGSDPGRPAADRLLGRLSDVEPGETVALTVVRDGTEQTLDVETVAFERSWFGAPGQRIFVGPGLEQLERLGEVGGIGPRIARGLQGAGRWRQLELVTLTPALGAYFGTEQGLLVVRAPADNELGLRDGDVILDIGGRTPNSPEHAMRILASFAPGETLQLAIMREQQRQTVELEVPAAARRR